MKIRLITLIVAALFVLSVRTASAKVDLVSLPSTDSVQLTIYNDADVTLVKDLRTLTLAKGRNKLQFSWENTLIDPTSLEMRPLADSENLNINELVFPPRIKDLGIWNLESGQTGKVPVEISYMTSGLSWRAFYVGILDSEQTSMGLEGFVRVTNNSGEDYAGAQVRLLVGVINLKDTINSLAERQEPYGKPTPQSSSESDLSRRIYYAAKARVGAGEGAPVYENLQESPKEILKEALSEYQLYTVGGTETISNGWSKRMPSMKGDGVGVINLYKFDEARYKDKVFHFISFKNDKEHGLGQDPLPEGTIKIYRRLNGGGLSYVGQSDMKYIPLNEKVELSLGEAEGVMVEPKLMGYSSGQFLFDKWGGITGHDEIENYELIARNTRNFPAEVEIVRNFECSSWDIKNTGDYGQYEKQGFDSVKYVLSLEPGETKKFGYIVTKHLGERAVKN
ncbi:MAG: hypothetical protein WA666_09920 [Nitrospirota bacterium]